MTDTVQVREYFDSFIATMQDATVEAARALAYRILEHAQANIRKNDQIDTGFMVNSGYVIWPDGSDYDAAKGAAENQTTGKDGKPVDHTGDMAEAFQLPADASAGVVFGAVYSVYQENINPFLYPAGQAAGAEFNATVEAVYKRFAKDDSGNWVDAGKVARK